MPGLTNKIFSGTTLMQLVADTDEAVKVRFDNEETEAKLSFFLLVRKAFNDAYDQIRDHLVTHGKLELGEAFSGITGEFVRGSYTERGGSKYGADEQLASKVKLDFSPDDIDPELFDVSVMVKPKQDAVKQYIKQHRELPPGVVENPRSKSLSIQPTKEAKAFLEEINSKSEDVLYDLDIPEIIDAEDEVALVQGDEKTTH